MHGDVAIGVGRRIMLEGNSRPIEFQSLLILKNFSGNCSGGPGRECEVPTVHSRRSGEVLSCIRMSENGRTCGVQPFVAIGVVKVPMRVDQALDWVGAD